MAASAVALSSLASAPCQAQSYERTEVRAVCREHTPVRRPLFGDLHVHSSYSFDSYTSGQRNDPWAAYRFAKGEPVTLPDASGNQVVRTRLRRPLDFAYDSLGIRVVGVHKYADYLRLWHKFMQKFELLGLHSNGEQIYSGGISTWMIEARDKDQRPVARYPESFTLVTE